MKDAKGQVWTPRVTCSTLLEFEQTSGIKLLEEFNNTLATYLEGRLDAKRVETKVLGSAICKIFSGKFENLLLAAWCSIPKSDRKNIKMDDLFDSLNAVESGEFLAEAAKAYMDFFLGMMQSPLLPVNESSTPEKGGPGS